METFKQARDLMEWVRDYHRRMKASYGEAARSASNDRAVMLFQFLEQHEAAYEEMIDQAVTDHDEALDTWIQFTPDKERLDPLNTYEPKADMTPQEVADSAQRMDEALVKFYQDAIELVKTKRAREVFEQLLEKQKSDRAKLAEHLQSIDRGV